MTTEMPSGRVVSVAAHLFTVVIAGAGGAALGALVVGLGFLVAYTDRVMPFYYAGALAGLATAVLFTAMRPWSRDEAPKERVRSALAAVVGTFVLWMRMSAPYLGMSLSERAVASLLWLAVVALLLLLIGRKNLRTAARKPD